MTESSLGFVQVAVIIRRLMKDMCPSSHDYWQDANTFWVAACDFSMQQLISWSAQREKGTGQEPCPFKANHRGKHHHFSCIPFIASFSPPLRGEMTQGIMGNCDDSALSHNRNIKMVMIMLTNNRLVKITGIYCVVCLRVYITILYE